MGELSLCSAEMGKCIDDLLINPANREGIYGGSGVQCKRHSWFPLKITGHEGLKLFEYEQDVNKFSEFEPICICIVLFVAWSLVLLVY